jgi:hypothetical protein
MLPCEAHRNALGVWSRSSCPPRMLCVPHELSNWAMDACSCEFSHMFALDPADQNFTNGTQNAELHCHMTEASYFLVAFFSFLAVCGIMLGLFSLYILCCAKISKTLKSDALGVSSFLLVLVSFAMALDLIFRTIFLMASTDSLANLSETAIIPSSIIFCSLFMLLLAFCGHAMLLALMQLSHLPMDDSKERKIIRRLAVICLAFISINVPLRVLQHFPLANFCSIVLACVCWKTFQRASSKMWVGETLKIVNPRVRLLNHGILRDIRTSMSFFMALTFLFAIISAIALISWQISNTSASRVFQTVETSCDVVLNAIIVLGLGTLVRIVAVMTRQRVQIRVNMRAIACVSQTSYVPRRSTLKKDLTTTTTSSLEDIASTSDYA